MDLPSSSESSLYQVAQGFTSPSPAITISTATLKGVVRILVDLLIEQQLSGSVWLKLPSADDWQEQISRLHNKGKLENLYLCNLRQERATLAMATTGASYNLATQLTELTLETSAYLKRECFFLIISPQLQTLLLAQQYPGEQDVSPWQIIYSFATDLIHLILSRIKQDLTITDKTPVDLLKDTPLPAPHSSTVQSKLITSLLLKHIQLSEENQKLINRSIDTKQSLIDLSQSLHFQEELLKNLTQEIGVPLTNMKTALSLLDSMQSKREQRQRYLELLQRECEKQNFLFLGIKEFMQLEQMGTNVETYPRLEDLIPGIVSTYQPLAEERGISLGYTIPAGFPSVACPEPWLRQILLNLLHNSLKFTPANGRVYVQAALKQDQVELTVSDTGIGIELGDIPKIFNSFYRGRNLAPEQTNSAGLGLAVVKHLLNRCGGKIHVNSKVDRGTTFTLNIPVNTMI